MVGSHRARTGIQFFDGGDASLLRKMRAHGNFTENVPIALLAMAAAELTGAPRWVFLVGGCPLLAGRAVLAYVAARSGWGNGRAVGMVLTLFSIGWLAIWAPIGASR
jgi:uncharacterized membrane protein YecN with MAPEG domain